MRTVKSILRITLREAVQETALSEADSHAYEDAFQYYIDMLQEYSNQGIVTGYEEPLTLNDDIGNGKVTNMEMAFLLLMRVSSLFAYQPTLNQNAKADRAEENLMAAQEVPEMKKNPVPSAYPYYDRNPVSCCNKEADDEI